MSPPFHPPQLQEVTSATTPTQDTVTLKKALEWELSLDKCDLRSHAWYYGSITRQYADELIQKDGDFLVRDCVSQPGNYVLTCMAKGALLHFVINKVRLLVKLNKRKCQLPGFPIKLPDWLYPILNLLSLSYLFFIQF